MPLSGLFVVLYDEDTLKLYLKHGVYGFLMAPDAEEGNPQARSRHYAALADYACARQGTHIFFFQARRVVYGGQVLGRGDVGAFHLNGTLSRLGKVAQSPLVWDESVREIYHASGTPGRFDIATDDRRKPRCQPYLLRFEDRLGIRGRYILSDQLYWEIGRYPYPLPSNTIMGMSFCTITPRETGIALELLRDSFAGQVTPESPEPVSLRDSPTAYDPAFWPGRLVDVSCESELEARLIADLGLLPPALRPREPVAICRQVPVCPFKPDQLDRADICFYYEDGLREGSLPNVLVELKKDTAGKNAVEQVDRYLRWMHICAPDVAGQVRAYVLALRFARTAEPALDRAAHAEQVELLRLRD